MKKNNSKIRLTESELDRLVRNVTGRLVNESVNRNRHMINEAKLKQRIAETVDRNIRSAVNEGLGNALQGAWQGMRQGADNMNAANTTLHTVSAALSTACGYFGEIYKALANNNTKQAMDICMKAYGECKGSLNDTYGQGQGVTAQYGAKPKPNY